MSTLERITVIGAGHGGKAMAAHLSLMGAKVTLFNRTFEHISIIKKRGGIELESGEELLPLHVCCQRWVEYTLVEQEGELLGCSSIVPPPGEAPINV